MASKKKTYFPPIAQPVEVPRCCKCGQTPQYRYADGFYCQKHLPKGVAIPKPANLPVQKFAKSQFPDYVKEESVWTPTKADLERRERETELERQMWEEYKLTQFLAKALIDKGKYRRVGRWRVVKVNSSYYGLDDKTLELEVQFNNRGCRQIKAYLKRQFFSKFKK